MTSQNLQDFPRIDGIDAPSWSKWFFSTKFSPYHQQIRDYIMKLQDATTTKGVCGFSLPSCKWNNWLIRGLWSLNKMCGKVGARDLYNSGDMSTNKVKSELCMN
jgi:hypothetical protein